VICPFLGTPGDFRTSLAFPSRSNYCHRCTPVVVVSLEHQKNRCLAGDYETCPAFLQPPNGALPHNLRNTKSVRSASRKTFWKFAFVIPVLLIIFGWNFITRGGSFPIILFPQTSPSGFVSPTLLPISITPSPEQHLVPVSPITFTPSPMPTFSDDLRSRVTPIITRSPHGMEDLIGVNYIFKIHRVQQGWDIQNLASYYNTTVAAVIAVNYKLTTPIYPGQVVIIPVNQKDVSGLPQFESYQVAKNITMEEISIQLNVDPEQLRYFNQLEISDQLMAKEWIIVPREKKETQ
jgi:LysM repeat protein